MTQSKPKDFEAALKELEQLVAKLEGGNLPLEESISLYERGIKLNQQCEAQLKKAESKIEELKVLLKQTAPPEA